MLCLSDQIRHPRSLFFTFAFRPKAGFLFPESGHSAIGLIGAQIHRTRLTPAIEFPDNKSQRATVRVAPKSDGAAVYLFGLAKYFLHIANAHVVG